MGNLGLFWVYFPKIRFNGKRRLVMGFTKTGYGRLAIGLNGPEGNLFVAMRFRGANRPRSGLPAGPGHAAIERCGNRLFRAAFIYIYYVNDLLPRQARDKQNETAGTTRRFPLGPLMMACLTG